LVHLTNFNLLPKKKEEITQGGNCSSYTSVDTWGANKEVCEKMFPDYTYLPESTQVINRKKPETCFRVTQRPDGCDDFTPSCFINIVMPRYKFEDAFVNCRIPREIYNELNLITVQDYFKNRIEYYLTISRKEVVLKWTLEKKMKEYQDTYNKFIRNRVNKYIEKLTLLSNEYMKFKDKFKNILQYFNNTKYNFVDIPSKNSIYEDYLNCSNFFII
jgi:hypothetical protein